MLHESGSHERALDALRPLLSQVDGELAAGLECALLLCSFLALFVAFSLQAPSVPSSSSYLLASKAFSSLGLREQAEECRRRAEALEATR